MKFFTIAVFSISVLLYSCNPKAIREKFLEMERKDNERYEKFKRGEAPLIEVKDFNDYFQRMIYCFDNELNESAIQFIKWYPSYHRQTLESLEYGTLVVLFSKLSTNEKNRYYDFVIWYKNLDG